ncbi:MAG TPA: spermidine/putrescine ABC transporter substrate-binding protein [Ruminococcaceae bacterium]|nr:spermidine/putrescine ABC transporter substrate-binding protein [Oscillospiraceae bacterium]
MKKILSAILCAAMLSFTAVYFTGCGSKTESKGEVNVYNWDEYLANGEDDLLDVVDEFEKATGIKVNYTTYSTNEELYNKLKSSNDSYDVIVPSEYMVSKLIRENMLLELNYDNIPNYKYLNSRFKNLACDPDGKYTVCSNWGVTALVYDKTKVKTKPKNWDALWDKNLKGEILMINNSRDAMAIAMQTLGIDPAKSTKADIDKAAQKLKEQKPLLKSYVMDRVFNEMEGSQAAIAPYYAGDIAVMMEENKNLDYVLPDYGSNLFYDAFCIPTCCANKENAEAFINFMQKPEIAAENCKYLRYGCPNDEAIKLLPDDIKNSELTIPSDEYLDKCYVFSDVDDDVYAYMQEQFVKIKAE